MGFLASRRYATLLMMGCLAFLASCSSSPTGIVLDGAVPDGTATDAAKTDGGGKHHGDSGGPCSGADACGTGTGCTTGSECKSLVCKAGMCLAPTPSDGVKNDSETDTDCGGATLANGKPNPASDGAPACANGKSCDLDADCTSASCQAGKCVPPTCVDKLMDGQETDVDCGGPTCAGCPTGDKCLVARDCASLDCKNDVCLAPTDTDGIKNDSETDKDCGGALLASGQPNPKSDGAPACAVGQTCLIGADCADGVCATGPVLIDNLDGGVDAASTDAGSGVLTCQPATDHDGVKNDSETDKDCGGALLADGSTNPASDGAPACAAGKACALASDCQSLVCTAGVCASPSATDGIKNDSETDKDCGGSLLASGAANPASDGAPACADGLACILGTDCVDRVCFTGAVTTPSNGSPINCPAGQTCTCQPPSPTDGVQNDSETDVDCGGDFVAGGAANASSDRAPTCAVGKQCTLGSDCAQRVCNSTGGAGKGPTDCPAGDACTCQAPSDADGVKNDSETDVDCGGGKLVSGAANPSSDGAPVCAAGQGCLLGNDCASLVCFTGVVTTPSTGGAPIDCPAGSTCTCQLPTATDGVKNGGELNIDCGGATIPSCTKSATLDCAPGCQDSQSCNTTADCLSGLCTAFTDSPKVCVAAPSCVGTEPWATIMDLATCAGGRACPAGTTCNTATSRCVVSTTPVTPDPGLDYHEAYGTPDTNAKGQHAGLDTCGTGEATDPLASQHHESCCSSLLLPGSTTVRLDKYEVTAGRMRQFVEAVSAQMLADATHNPSGYPYDIRDWALLQMSSHTAAGATLSAQVPAAAIQLLPQTYYYALNIEEELGATTMDSTYPSDLQGCYTSSGANGASTYWFPYSDADGMGLIQVSSPSRPYTQDYYDIKSMNCAPSFLYAAFCAWDGGFLPTPAQMQEAYGTGQYPWSTSAQTGAGAPFEPSPYPVTSALFPNITSFLQTVNWDNSSFGNKPGLFYFYPNGGSMSTEPGEVSSTGLDFSPFIASPGRFPLDLTLLTSTSYPGSQGWHDLGANLMETTAPASLTGGAPFCDCGGMNSGDTSNCTCSVYGGGTVPGVWRPNATTKFPDSSWEGGSWEGHPYGSPQGTDSGGSLVATEPMFDFVYPSYNFPIFAQYGKMGVRCARNAE